MSGLISKSLDMRNGIVGRFPTGHVLQVQHHLNVSQTSIVNTSTVVLTKTFNRLSGTSHFVCTAHVSFGMYAAQANQDTADPRLRWTINGSDRTTNGTLTSDGFYYSDYPSWWHGESEFDGKGDIYNYHGSEDFTHISSGDVGDSVVIAVTAQSGTLGIYVNRSQGLAGSGGISTLCILEMQ